MGPRRSRLKLAAAITAVTGLLVGGGAAGWWLHGEFAPTKGAVLNVHATVKRPITPLTAAGHGTMPSIIGLSHGEAQRALFDAGIDSARIHTTNVPAAGQTGLVVTQDPAAGTPAGTGTNGSAVALGISTPAKVPPVIGEKTDDARTVLAALGARVTVTQRYSPHATEGTVLSVTPHAGATLPLTAAMVVASPASAVYLDTLTPVTSDCSNSDNVAVNGTSYIHAVTCTPSQDNPSVADYVLNRRVTAFTALVGQDDAGQTGTSATIQFARDGHTLRTITVTFGVPKHVTVDVTGALRLTVTATWSHPKQDQSNGPSVVYANPRFVGSPAAITALVKETGQ